MGNIWEFLENLFIRRNEGDIKILGECDKLTVVGRAIAIMDQLHREIWKLFPDRPDDKRDFLFRVENLGRREPQKILLQSIKKPIPNKTSLITLIDTYEVEKGKLKKNMYEGKLLRFLIRANPTKRIKDESKTRNQGRVRVPLIDENEMKAWLSRQLEDSAKLREVMIAGQNLLYFRKGPHAGKTATVTFSGLLEVADSGLLLERMKSGIGPAKAFGCGLLSLAKV